MATSVAMTIAALIASAGHRDSSMAHDRLLNSGRTRALTDLLANLADLVRTEMQLAKAEVTEKIASGLRASVWMVAAVVLGLIAALLMVEAAVFAIASFGLALQWSCLLAAAVLAAGCCLLMRSGGSSSSRAASHSRHGEDSDRYQPGPSRAPSEIGRASSNVR